MGTTGVTGCADALLVLTRERGKADAVLHVTGRDVSENELALAKDDYCGWTVLGNAEELRLSQERRDVISALQCDGGASKTPKQVATLIGKSLNATQQLMRRMAFKDLIKSHGDGTYSSLPQSV